MSEKDYADIGLPKVRELRFFLYMYIFAFRELMYRLNISDIRRYRRDLESGLRSSPCLRESFPAQRLVIEPIEDAHYRTCYFTLTRQAN